MSSPRISVVVPNYNHAKLLPRCLDALLEQSAPPEEILVVDDASTDDSLQVLEAYARKSPLIRVHRNERNLGVVPTMNRGLSLARGDHVCFPAADDRVLPGLFESAIRLLTAHPRAGLVSGMCEWRCEDTGLVWYQGTRMPAEECYLAPDDLVRLSREGRFSVAAQHAVFRRDALEQAGGWIPDLRWFTDVFATWTVAFRHGVCHVPRVLSVFHTARTSYYHSARSQEERRRTMERFLELLGEERYADVAARVAASGLLGGLGSPITRVVLQGRHRHFLTRSFVRHAARRGAEVAGRRLLPQGIARVCARLFYGRPRVAVSG